MERLYLKKPTKAELVFLLLYLSVFFAVGMTLVMKQPFSNTRESILASPDEGDDYTLPLAPPDEGDRYTVPQFIYESGALPTGDEEEVQIPGYGGSYAYLPIFPYIVMGTVMRIVHLFSADPAALRIAARLVNLCFGTAMAFIIWLLGRRLFCRKTTLAVFCCGIMYLPQLLFLHTYVNTESLSLLSQALILYALVRMSQEGVGLKNSLIFSLGAILCTLSYYNAYAYLLVSVFWFICCCFVRPGETAGAENKGILRLGSLRLDLKRMLLYGGLIILCWCIGAGWWFVRNIILHGDMLGLDSLANAQAEVMQYGLRAPTPQQQGMGIIEMIRQPAFLQTVYHSFVAEYGSMSILPPGWIYISYRWVYILLLAGCVWRGIRVYIGKRKAAAAGEGKKAEVKEDTPEKVRVLGLPYQILLMVICLITAGLWIYYCYALDFQMQGRYLMPCAIPLYIWLAMGAEKWLGYVKSKYRPLAGALLCAFWLLILFSYVFGVAMPLYG